MSSAQRPMKILVVDDDEGIREVLKISLELEGYTVSSAENGKEGLEMLSRDPDQGLVLLDLMMPVMNGWEFVEEMRKHPTFSHVPVVLMTAYPDQISGILVNEIVRKPTDLDNLLDVIKKYYN